MFWRYKMNLHILLNLHTLVLCLHFLIWNFGYIEYSLQM